MHRSVESIAPLTVACLAWACAEGAPPTTPNLAVSSTGVAWTTPELACPDGVKRAQLQGITPLDERGDLILVGRSTCFPGSEDFQVFDLSSGGAVAVDAIDTQDGGFNLGTHSPPGDPVGFAVEGRTLVVYEPNLGFSLVPFACDGFCTAWSVWAASRNDVWIALSGLPGRILHYHGGEFRTEFEGFDVLDLWGFGDDPAIIYAVGDGILRRDPDGSWRELMSPEVLPASCGAGLFSVHGTTPADVWVGGDGPCLIRVHGESWTEVTPPADAVSFLSVWSLPSGHVLVAGQGGVDLTQGLVALWISTDGGASWIQLANPAFTTLPGTLDASFFNLAATADGSRILAPSIGGTLLLGKVSQSALSGLPASSRGASVPVVPEQ